MPWERKETEERRRGWSAGNGGFFFGWGLCRNLTKTHYDIITSKILKIAQKLKDSFLIKKISKLLGNTYILLFSLFVKCFFDWPLLWWSTVLSTWSLLCALEEQRTGSFVLTPEYALLDLFLFSMKKLLFDRRTTINFAYLKLLFNRRNSINFAYLKRVFMY